MVRRFACLAVCLVVLVLPARAEITNSDLVALADAYAQTLTQPADDVSVTETLRLINEARKQERAVDVVRLSETLVALDAGNAQLWLNLSRAWLATDKAANNGLAAAIRAASLSASNDDRLEALLMASSYLRAQLTANRSRYNDALSAIDDVDKALAQARDLAANQDFAGSKEDNPEGRIQALEKTRAQATEASEIAAGDIAVAAASLDDIYREIQSGLPSANIAEMRGGDDRLDFYPLANQYDVVAPDFRIKGNDVEACLTFNKPLKENSRIYGSLIGLKTNNAALPDDAFDVNAKGADLCLLRLQPGAYYEATLLADLPAQDDITLGAAQTVYFTMPNLPSRIGFADGEFMLPRSGPGDLPVSLTNTEAFPLSIHRIVDRALHRHLALGHIRNGIPTAEYRDLITQFSEVLWDGKAARPLEEKERNTTVRTFVPVRSILEDRADWLARGDNTDWDRKGLLRSTTQPVRSISDAKLSISGNFVAGPLDTDPQIAKQFVPGVYALVTPVPDTGPNREFHCKGESADYCNVYAAQWFVITDIGLTFYEGERDFTVLARSLTTGGPVANAQIQLVTKGNRVLAEALTDANGAVKFDRSLTIGEASNALVAIMAETEGDFNFLAYGPERLDLSRLNVSGSGAAAPAGAMIYTDRGIYQPGESAEVLALMRNRTGGADAVRGVELRLEIADYVVKARPVDGKEWRDGGTLISLAIPDTAKPGTAALKLVSGANDVLAETTLQIGKIRPDRARIIFPTGDDERLNVRPASADAVEIAGKVRAQYLYGAEGTGQAPAANLKAEVTVRVAPVASPIDRCYGDLVFGRFDDQSLPAVSRNDVFYTDKDGVLSMRLPRVRLPATSRPVAATVEVTVYDAAGPVASGHSTVSVPARDAAIGVSIAPKPVLGETGGYRLALDIAAVGADGTAALRRDVEVLVERERESYAWENIDGVWQHTQLRQREEVSRATVRLDRADPVAGPCPGVVSVPEAATGIDDGRYVVTVTDPSSGAVASTRFTTGVAQTSVEDLEPNIFVLTSDKERYAPGETVSLTVEAPFRTGEVLVAVAAGDILKWVSGEVRDNSGTVTFTADPTWSGQGLYALATVFKADPGDARSYGPTRALGAAYFEVSAQTATFALSVRRDNAGLDDFIRPDEPLRFDVCVNGPAGECGVANAPQSYAVAYVVDEGLLSLTGHAAEAARLQEQIIGKARLGLRVMDNYGRLLLKEGGDRPGRQALSNYTSTSIVAAASGPVLMQDGKASFNFDDLDLHTGSLKIFVVVWNTQNVASAGETVPVRHFVVSSLGTPEFFLAGDQPLLPLRLENISFIDHPGDYSLAFNAEGGIGVGMANLDGSAILPGADGAFHLKIPQGEPQDLFLRLNVPSDIEGNFQLSLDLTAEGAQIPLPPAERRRAWNLAVRPSAVAAQEYISFPLTARPTDLAGLLAGLVEDRYSPGTVKVMARFAGGNNVLRLASLSGSDTSPDPVLDDMIWRGFVDLQNPASARDELAKTRVQANIDSVQALQLVDGAFAPYRTDGDFLPTEIGFDRNQSGDAIRHGLLRNASALDFLLRARKAGFSVSGDAIGNSVAFIKGRVSDAIAATQVVGPELLCEVDTRYAMLVLVQQGQLGADDVRALGDCDEHAADDGSESDDSGASEADFVEVSAGQSALSDLVTLAVMSEFGEPVDAEKALSARYDDPGQYLGDLDQYRKAIAVSMLAHTGVRDDVLRSLAGSFLGSEAPLDLRTRAWLARSVADLDLPEDTKLTAADLDASDPDLAALNARPDGVVETAEIAYDELAGRSLAISQTGGPQARAFVRIGGKLLNGQDLSLPESSIRRRYFHADSGREFSPSSDRLEVGDLLVVMLEATPEALDRFANENFADLGFTYGPLSVESLLPSAFTLVSPDLSAVTPKGELAKLTMAGNVRAVEAEPQRWRAIIVPASSSAVETLDRDADEDPAAPVEGIEFRQAFVVSVSAAGSFLFPSATIDPLDFPGTTLLSQQATLEVAIPAGPRR